MSERRDDQQPHALASARALEHRGLVDQAADAYLAARQPEEAARVLVAARRYAQAGRVLLSALDATPATASRLAAAGRKRALQAAICLARGNETQTALAWFVALGEKQRAEELLRRAGEVAAAAKVTAPASTEAGAGAARLAGARRLEEQGRWGGALDVYLELQRPGDAGRVAMRAGQPRQAAALFEQASMPWEAAGAWHEAREYRKTLEALQQVAREAPRYPDAAIQAIRIASHLDLLDFQLEHFLTPFVTQPPGHERALDALYLLAALYERHDFEENAKDAYRKVLARAPGYRDVAAKLAALEQRSAGNPALLGQILKESASFRGDPAAGLPALPDLPDLPDLQVTALGWADGTRVTSAPTVVPQPIAAAQPTPPPAYRPPPAHTLPVSPPVSPPSPPTRPAPTLRLVPGEVLAGRYRLDAKIGQGGMASVFRAHDLELGEDVAIKLFTTLVEDEQMVQRFKQELLLSRQLNHPNIIRLYDIGTVSGFKYITMELLSGRDLKELLGQPMEPRRSVELMLEVCAALQHAHDRGVVHRDIKPANIFVTDDGQAKLMDFGIAKRTATPGLTVAGMIAGTPEYMSPEQINGFDKVTASTDLYALGVVLFEMFTGTLPFRSPEMMPLLVMQLTEPPPSPRSRNPALPQVLEDIILRLLAKDPKQRMASCRELAVALARLL